MLYVALAGITLPPLRTMFPTSAAADTAVLMCGLTAKREPTIPSIGASGAPDSSGAEVLRSHAATRASPATARASCFFTSDSWWVSHALGRVEERHRSVNRRARPRGNDNARSALWYPLPRCTG